MSKVLGIRKDELRHLRIFSYLNAAYTVIMNSAPVLVSQWMKIALWSKVMTNNRSHVDLCFISAKQIIKIAFIGLRRKSRYFLCRGYPNQKQKLKYLFIAFHPVIFMQSKLKLMPISICGVPCVLTIDVSIGYSYRALLFLGMFLKWIIFVYAIQPTQTWRLVWTPHLIPVKLSPVPKDEHIT